MRLGDLGTTVDLCGGVRKGYVMHLFSLAGLNLRFTLRSVEDSPVFAVECNHEGQRTHTADENITTAPSLRQLAMELLFNSRGHLGSGCRAYTCLFNSHVRQGPPFKNLAKEMQRHEPQHPTPTTLKC